MTALKRDTVVLLPGGELATVLREVTRRGSAGYDVMAPGALASSFYDNGSIRTAVVGLTVCETPRTASRETHCALAHFPAHVLAGLPRAQS